VGLGGGNYCSRLYSVFHYFLYLHDCMGGDMVNALDRIVTAVRASWSRSQEWMPCARVLWHSLHRSRPYTAAQRNDGLARSERRPLQINRIRGDLEQLVRVGRYGRLRNKVVHGYKDALEREKK
jgi:hypothetical protein